MGLHSTIVVSSQPIDEHDLRQQKPPLQHRIADGTHFWASRFFPWSADNEQVNIQDLTKARYVPWLGLFALVASGLTILFSWVVLHVIDGKPQIEASYLKPASWLSAILSSNSVLLHVALSEGVTTAWWFTASRRNATVRDIHDTWSMGQSLSSVLLSGKRFNYVALATLFVASIPLNGLLLQNAITTIPGIHTNKTLIDVGMAAHLPSGFSADLFHGAFSAYSDVFGMATTLVDGDNGAVDNTYTNLDDFQNAGGCGSDDLVGTCTANIESPGFVSNCTTTYLPYDLSPQNHQNQPFSGVVYSSSIGWDPATPNIFNLTVVAKGLEDSCVGDYTVRHCTFRAAQISYPIELMPASQLGQNSPIRKFITADYQQNFVSLNANSTWKDDKFVSYLPAESEIDAPNSTFGGLAHYLQSTYNAELIWSWNGSVWSIDATGKSAENAVLDTYNLDSGDENGYGNRSLTSPDFCKSCLYNVFEQDQGLVVELAMHDRIRNLMFFSSILQYGYHSDVAMPQTNVQAERSAPVLIYRILYRFWAASLALTSAVILMITPTFWGFWRLRGKVTLSPVDTAIALEAPLVRTDREMDDPRSRLKEIGERPLYSARSGGGSGGGYMPS